MNPESYCRDLEAYLCRKNDGHLIRIVGPAFERVCDWARQGIPFAVACEGIDRYFERYYRRGPRRRPVRIEFCEADVLDAFDAWRRAVGVAQEAASATRTRPSLAAHVEHAIARLTALRASSQRTHAFEEVLDAVVRDLDALQPRARTARGRARDEVVGELAALDRRLIDAVIVSLPASAREAAFAAAGEQLTPFRDRMASDAYERARAAAAERHVRELYGVPTVAFE
jgi:hypothetical protein